MFKLPARPNLDQLRRRSKELLRLARAGDGDSLARFRSVSDRVDLTTAQLVTAHDYGFRDWNALKQSVEGATQAVGPLVRDKHDAPAVFRPIDAMSWALGLGWKPGPIPTGMVFTSSSHLTKYLETNEGLFRRSVTLTPANGAVFMTSESPHVAIACLGPGATPVVTELENLVELGVSNFIAVGPAPTLSDLDPDDCVVVEQALRDDGVSQHYLAPARYVAGNFNLSKRLQLRACDQGLIVITGNTWTVPTPYRTTSSEVELFRAEGVLITELVTAALFAVAEALGVRAASAAIITRQVGQAPEKLDRAEPRDATVRLLHAAINAIKDINQEEAI